MSEDNEDLPLDETSESHDDETPAFEEVEEQLDLSEHVEPIDPLEEAIERAEKAEKKLTKKQGYPQLKEDPNAKDQSTDERVDLDSKGTESLTEEE